jgi:hypothetical protein
MSARKDSARDRRRIPREQLDFFDQAREDVRRAAWHAVKHHDCLPELAAAVAEMNKWKCSEASACDQVSKWLNPDVLRPMPHYLLPLVSALTGESLGVVETQLEAVATHRRMRRVEGEPERRRVNEWVE